MSTRLIHLTRLLYNSLNPCQTVLILFLLFVHPCWRLMHKISYLAALCCWHSKESFLLNVLSKAVTELKCCVGGLDSHTAPRDFWPVSGASEDVFASLWTGWLLVSLLLAKFLFGTEDCLWSYWAMVIFGPLDEGWNRQKYCLQGNSRCLLILMDWVIHSL